MKLSTIKLLLLVTFVMVSGGIAQAQACGLQTLNGSYAFKTTGNVYGVPGLPDGTPAGWVGTSTFDGTGAGFTSSTGSIGGNIFTDPVPSSLNYTVKKDCTGTLVVHLPFGDAEWNLVISDNGKKILTILRVPTWVFFGEYSKQ